MQKNEKYTILFLPHRKEDRTAVLSFWRQRRILDRSAESMPLALKTLIGALIIFLPVTAYVVFTGRTAAPHIPYAEVGVEHTQKGSLTMTVTRKGPLRMITIVNDNAKTLSLSVRQDWLRGEVRNATLAQVTADAPSFGYVRWHLPARASVTFSTDIPFDRVRLHDPSGPLLQINFTQVDLLTAAATHDVYLVKDGSVDMP